MYTHDLNTKNHIISGMSDERYIYSAKLYIIYLYIEQKLLIDRQSIINIR